MYLDFECQAEHTLGHHTDNPLHKIAELQNYAHTVSVLPVRFEAVYLEWSQFAAALGMFKCWTANNVRS